MPKKMSNLKRDEAINAIRSGDLSRLGDVIEEFHQYKGYYKKGTRAFDAGPWRNDKAAAEADTYPYALQGLETGIRTRIAV